MAERANYLVGRDLRRLAVPTEMPASRLARAPLHAGVRDVADWADDPSSGSRPSFNDAGDGLGHPQQALGDT
jgi:hypothetical protein